jgi:hypothetical protein
MLSLYAALFALATPAHEQPAEGQARHKWLIIELPDGVRGGTGRIQGGGKYPSAKSEPYPLYLLHIVRGCGASFPMFFDNWSHSSHIVTWSTAKDREVVSCLRAKMPTHFNVGLAEPDARRGFTMLDATPFQEFETAPRPSR